VRVRTSYPSLSKDPEERGLVLIGVGQNSERNHERMRARAKKSYRKKERDLRSLVKEPRAERT